MLGDFLAYQFVTDLNYSNLSDFVKAEFSCRGARGARDPGIAHESVFRIFLWIWQPKLSGRSSSAKTENFGPAIWRSKHFGDASCN